MRDTGGLHWASAEAIKPAFFQECVLLQAAFRDDKAGSSVRDVQEESSTTTTSSSLEEADHAGPCSTTKFVHLAVARFATASTPIPSPAIHKCFINGGCIPSVWWFARAKLTCDFVHGSARYIFDGLPLQHWPISHAQISAEIRIKVATYAADKRSPTWWKQEDAFRLLALSKVMITARIWILFFEAINLTI